MRGMWMVWCRARRKEAFTSGCVRVCDNDLPIAPHSYFARDRTKYSILPTPLKLKMLYSESLN